MSVRYRKIRQIVNDLLVQHGISKAPVDLDTIVSSLNITVHIAPTEPNLSGYLLRDRTKKVSVIGVNADHHPRRQRFTIAHELGHYLLHSGYEVHVDRTGSGSSAFVFKMRNELSSEGTEDEEKEANHFAAELLMPAKFIEADIQRVGHLDILEDSDIIAGMAESYEVSTQALGFRLANLGLIEL